MRKKNKILTMKRHLIIFCLIFSAFFSLHAQSDSSQTLTDRQIMALLQEFEERISASTKYTLKDFKNLFISGAENKDGQGTPLNYEQLRLYIAEQIQQYEQNNNYRDPVKPLTNHADVPRGLVVTGNLPGGETFKLPLQLPDDADVRALFGEEYTDGQALAALGTGQRLPPYELVVKNSSGIPYQVKTLNGKRAIKVSPGRYTIDIINRSNEKVFVCVLIDGINQIYMGRELPSTGVKMILEPGKTYSLEGWQRDDRTTTGFQFTGAGDSVAARMGHTGQTGRITAVFYVETDPPLNQGPMNITRESNQATERGSAGTGEGPSQGTNSVQYVASGEKKAVQIIQIWYDF
jgi:hypothetical protein